MRIAVVALTLALALTFASTASAAVVLVNNDTAQCGTLYVTATGLAPNTNYQLVARGGYPEVVQNVVSNANGVASAVFPRAQFGTDSSNDWGNTFVRTQYGGYIASNPPGNFPPSYHFC